MIGKIFRNEKICFEEFRKYEDIIFLILLLNDLFND